MSRLLLGSPGTSAGPLAPPLRTASRVSSSRPPLLLPDSLEWQEKQLSARTGRIFFSKKATWSAVGGASLTTGGVFGSVFGSVGGALPEVCSMRFLNSSRER